MPIVPSIYSQRDPGGRLCALICRSSCAPVADEQARHRSLRSSAPISGFADVRMLSSAWNDAGSGRPRCGRYGSGSDRGGERVRPGAGSRRVSAWLIDP
jgi:hypothetical protein